MAGTGQPAAWVPIFVKTITLDISAIGPLNSTDACACTNSTGPCYAPLQQRCSSAWYVTGAKEKLACLSAALHFRAALHAVERSALLSQP